MLEPVYRKDPLLEYVKWNSLDVNENANRYMGPTGFFSYLLEEYMMNNLLHLLPERVLKAHMDGYIHVHKLPFSIYIPYCTGHSIARLLEKGLKTPTITSRPARHFDTFVDHIANYLITLQHYFTGAQAFSSVEWYSGPFIRKDNLSYNAIKQQIQRLIFNLNYPTRVGMQCLSEDTRILTPNGWKSYNKIKEGDPIYTFNLKTKKIEIKPVRKIAIYRYNGIMYNLRNRTQDQLISPRHRVVWLSFNNHDVVKYSPIEDLLKYKSPIPIPTPAYTDYEGEDLQISDDEIRLIAWILSDGHIEKTERGTPRVTIIQSPKKYLEEIKKLLRRMRLNYSEIDDPGLGYAVALRLDAESSRKVLSLMDTHIKKPPKWLYRLSRRQAKIFLDTFIKGDGWIDKDSNRARIVTTDEDIKDAIIAVAVLAGYNVSVSIRKPSNKISKKQQYIITLTDTKTDYIQSIEEKEYNGIIWSVNTENETVIAMRNGCVFITGNTPFTNFTVTLDAPKKMLEGDYAVYDGKKIEPLGVYMDEAKKFIKALTEILLEGDMYGQPFTFPIPTLMTTAKMIWDDPEIFETIFKTAAHRGSFYWLNTRVVDPDASYAMCLHKDERVIYRENNIIKTATMKELLDKYSEEIESIEPDGAIWYKARQGIEILALDPETGRIHWKPVKRFLSKKSRKGIRITLADGRRFIVTRDHPILVLRRDTGKKYLKKAEDLLNLKRIDTLRIPVLSKTVDGVEVTVNGEVEIKVDEEFAYFLGLYYGDGTMIRNKHAVEKYSRDKIRERSYISGLQFSSNIDEKKIREFILSYASKNNWPIREWNDPRYPSVHYIAIYSAQLARTLYDNGVSPFSDEKRIPWFIWSSKPSVRKRFIEGLLDSDGYFRKTSNIGYYELHIKNRELAEDTLLLASITGIPAYYRENSDGSFVVCFPASINGEFLSAENAWKHHRIEGDITWVSISRIEEIEFEEEESFIDVEVEGYHYFTHSTGVVTHNCCRINIDKNELLFAYSNKPKGLGLNFSLKKDIEEQREETLRSIEKQRFGGLWAMPDITGSVNVTTINLPRIALETGGNDDLFWERYSEILNLVRESEDWFRKRYITLMNRYPGMYSMIKEYLKEFPASHFNTIGILGLPEATAIYLQEPDLWFEGSRRDWLRATDVMKKMVEFAVKHARKWMRESGTPWNVEEVPGESAAAKLALKDSKKYPEVLEYLSDPDNPIYSTSIAPYYGAIELPERIEIESRVQKIFTGGVMMHIFLGEEPDPEALAKLTKRLIQTDLVYWSYTPAITHCNSCNRTFTGLYKRCPVCGSNNVEIWSRIIGYYRPLKNWNPYRRKEFWTRKHYKY